MRGDTLVLCYHAISETWDSALAVTTARLTEQLTYVLGRGYIPQTFTDAVLRPAGRRVVAVTFDDAYRSVLELGLPVLGQLGVPGTVFAPTAFIGREEPMRWDGIEEWLTTEHRDELMPLDWEELRTLAGADWEVGSHTITHPRLSTLEPAQLDRELQDSRAACESAMGSACTSIAYPYGDHDAAVVEAAGRAGYLVAGTLPERWHAATPLRYPRVGVYFRDDDPRFRLKASRTVRAVRSSSAWRLARAAPRIVRGRRR